MHSAGSIFCCTTGWLGPAHPMNDPVGAYETSSSVGLFFPGDRFPRAWPKQVSKPSNASFLP